METKTSTHHVIVSGDKKGFRMELTTESIEKGLDLVKLRMDASQPKPPPTIQLEWGHSAVDIHGVWDTDFGRRNNFIGTTFKAKSTSQAPVVCLFNMHGINRLAFALSDAMNSHHLNCWIDEYTAEYNCSVQLFSEPCAPFTSYEMELLIDTRPFNYVDTLQNITSWWEISPGYQPSPVPEAARQPVYSTWYSFHQNVTDVSVEKQCKLAKELGCELVIMDDGWQTDEQKSAYSSCGDWEVAPGRILDMNVHVSRVHELGMKYMLWYSVPFIGKKSKSWSQFEGKYLDYNEDFGAGILDPRFPEVREYLIQTYESGVLKWNLDGLKLDFVDYFNLGKTVPNELGKGRDYDSIPRAVDKLLSDVMDRLRKINPDIMIEFRQSYIGPVMRKYGNIFRVADCPNDLIINRVGTLDLRLLSGNTAVHSDMLMWHPDESADRVALQLIHTMFAVPQISVRLDRIPQEHVNVLRHWLSFWKENRDVILDGQIKPIRPDMLYPLVISINDKKMLAAFYEDMVLNIPKDTPDNLILVNGTLNKRVVIELEEDLPNRQLTVFDCQGQLFNERIVTYKKGFHSLEIPNMGILLLEKV